MFRQLLNRTTIRTILIGFLLVPSMLLLCACSTDNSAASEYEKTIEESTQKLEKYTHNIDTRIETIEQSLTVIQSELIKENVVIQAEDIVQEEPSAQTAFDVWIDAEMKETERYKYELIMDGFINADDEIARGWIDDGTAKFIKLIKGDSVSEEATAKELISIYRSFYDNIGSSNYSIQSFFCVDECGHSVNTGLYNFLRAIDELETEKFGGADIVFIENGKVVGWDFSSVGGDAAIAEALCISEELVLVLQHAAIDAGFVVSFD